MFDELGEEATGVRRTSAGCMGHEHEHGVTKRRTLTGGLWIASRA